MIVKEEIGSFVVITIVLAASFSFLTSFDVFLNALLAVFLVLFLNTFAKKVAAYYLESEIYVRPWSIDRYGFARDKYFEKPFPIGIFLPIIFAIITKGNFLWMASLVFDVKPKITRASKRHGLYSFSEMTEHHLGLIAATGVIINVLAGIVGYFLGFPLFAKLNIFLAFYNILPFSDLDGNKIFFGNMVFWSFLATVILIGLGYAFFLT